MNFLEKGNFYTTVLPKTITALIFAASIFLTHECIQRHWSSARYSLHR